MIGAALLALFAYLSAWVFASQNKKTERPRSMPLAIFSAFIGSVAMLVAFPKMLSWNLGIAGSMVGLLLIGAIGVIILLLAIGQSKLPTVFIALGMLAVVWVGFRLIPTAPAAFAHLGPNLAKSMQGIWDAFLTFFKDLVPG